MKKYLVITGASRGIGFATAKWFLEHDYHVINISRGVCSLDNVINIPMDLARQDLEENLKPKLFPYLEQVDSVVLIHNAGRLEKDSVDGIEADSLRAVLEVNVVVPAILNRMILPFMSKGSAIIYIGSTLSEKAVPGALSYVTSKHALTGLMRATCQDLMDSGIHTACICPGFTDTEMLRTHLNHDADILEQIKNMNAQNRLIDPEEIAESIYFAATHSVLNGAMIHANMGQRER